MIHVTINPCEGEEILYYGVLSQRIGHTGRELDIRTKPINTQFTDNAYAGRSSLLLGKKQTLLAQNVIGSTFKLEVATMGVKNPFQQ